ncbi:hypothetical protein PRIPAC_85610 [Pristionchus pacificus]|uniref:Uncharacterized protein n=1 Tax=Pristionchus pacificus TaxID=54126 RepID=A0A2A6CCB0_PRIPA|nr:hypothetical protein PRIPAC_85610 [Pristionchus pacificus]|eukprot:PDM75865.1 hypothetical protein PRIPAC_40244 [Pristionchus pacificus]
MDCCFVGAANRALLSVKERKFDEEDDETTVNVVVESSVKPANLGNEMVEAASSTEKYDLGDFVTPSVLPPKTNLHHNDNPFIIGSIIEKVPVNVVSSRTCVACRAPLPSSSSNPNIVIFHLERVQTNFNGDRIIRTLMAITHASRKCLRSRYPYSHKGMLLASQQLILRQTEADKLFLLKEFDVDLNSLGVAIRYVAHPRFKVSFKKDPSFLSDSFYRNLQVSARVAHPRFKVSFKKDPSFLSDSFYRNLQVSARVAHPRFKVSFKKDPSFLSDSFYRNLQVSARVAHPRFKVSFKKDPSFLSDSFYRNLQVSARVAHPRFKVSFKKDPSFLSDSFYRNLQVSARENRRFKIDRIFIHFHRHHLELFPRIALLWGRNMRQRAYELIQIAHPDQRQNLE